MEQRYVGLVAQACAGKGTLVDEMRRLAQGRGIGFDHCSSGDVPRKTLRLWGVPDPQTRVNCDLVVQAMKKILGTEAALTNASEQQLVRSSASIVVYDCLRLLPDEQMFRRRFPGGIMVYITAPDEKRWEWAKLRAEKPEEKDMSFQQFMEQERLLPQERYIKDIGRRADMVIENIGTREEYLEKIQKFFWQLRQG